MMGAQITHPRHRRLSPERSEVAAELPVWTWAEESLSVTTKFEALPPKSPESAEGTPLGTEGIVRKRVMEWWSL